MKTEAPGVPARIWFSGRRPREGWDRGITQIGFRRRFQKIAQPARAVALRFGGFGECLPNHNNYVELDKEKVDAWGIPVLKIHCGWSENELALRKDMAIIGGGNARRRRSAAILSPLKETIRPASRSTKWARRAWAAIRRRRC